MSGGSLSGCEQLAKLYLDHSCLAADISGHDLKIEMKYETAGAEQYLLKSCPHIERLSIKGTTWCASSSDIISRPCPTDTHPVSQGMLMKMVRNLPRLQWLRSDLSAENIATLKTERPEITFCV
jgi:hypothetical protein